MPPRNSDDRPSDDQDPWELFAQGQLEQAEAASIALHKAGAARLEALPFENIGLFQASLAIQQGRPDIAFEILYKVLSAFPDSPFGRELFLLLLQGLPIKVKGGHYRAPLQKRESKGRLIFGLGTGRSGSTSLTKLFMAQSQTYASHEHPPFVSWEKDDARGQFGLARMDALSQFNQQVVDVAHWWLPYAEDIIAQFPTAKLVVTQRDRDETIRSIMRIKGAGKPRSINHWVEHDGSFWSKNIWDPCYPKFAAETLEDAIAQYYDLYYARCEDLASQFPDHVKIFPITALSSQAGQNSILGFCAVETPVTLDALHANQTGVSDGLNLRDNPFKP